MKRNLFNGVILIGAVALSSCSAINNLSKTKILDDDVYYTKSQAGDSYDYEAQYVPPTNNYVRNDDYYYYGDYESRINRFSYFTPFDYDDDFYYSYTPYYNNANYNQTIAQAGSTYAYEPVYDDLGVYSAYDFGYGYYGGYDNFGYGFAYSTFVYGGGSRANYKKSYSHSNNRNTAAGGLAFTRGNAGLFLPASGANNNSVVNNGLSFSRVNSGTTTNNNNGAFSGSRPGGNNAVYPGRPGANSATQVVVNPNATRYIRPESQNPRPVVQQPTMDRVSTPSSNSTQSSSSNSSSGSSSSAGGGGRPVRP